MELLEMPETFILYRFFFKWLDDNYGTGTAHWRDCWNTCMKILSDNEKQLLLDIVHRNTFTVEEKAQVSHPEAKRLLGFYTNYRKDIITPGTSLYRQKQEYDTNPTFTLRRKQ